MRLIQLFQSKSIDKKLTIFFYVLIDSVTHRKRAQFVVHLHNNIRGEIVFLLARSLQQAKPQLNLNGVFDFVNISDIPVRCDISCLLRSQVEEE